MTQINLSAYKQDGFIHFKNFFPRDQIESIRADAKKIFITQMYEKGIVQPTSKELTEEEFESGMFDLFERELQTFIGCGKQAQHLISLHKLSLNDSIIEILRQLGLDFPNISTRPVIFFNSRFLAKKETYWRVFAHQDWRSMQGSLDSVVVWIPLMDIDRSLGALEIVPSSHKHGLLTTLVEDSFGKVESFNDRDFVPVEVEQGDALFFSAFLVHRSGNNVTNSIRWSCHFRYNNLGEKTFIERGYPHPYIYKPQDDLITPEFPPTALLDRLFT